MQRLLSEFSRMFDLDQPIHGMPLRELVERAIDELEEKALPDWGSAGEAGRRAVHDGEFVDFHYAPHLFPEMDLTLRLAHKLQFYMLPRAVPQDAPVSIASVLESYCHLSGDLFGWETLADGRFLIWIVDLSGHGVRSGLASAILRVIIDNLRHRSRIGPLVTELNATFLRCLRDGDSSQFATGFFMALAADGSARFVSAGHPPVLVRRGDGRIDELSSSGLPVGLFPDVRYTATEVRLEPGDTMLLYTDGVVETTNQDQEVFGVERLRRLMAGRFDTPRSLTGEVFRSIAAYQDIDRLDDDVTFVAARMKAR